LLGCQERRDNFMKGFRLFVISLFLVLPLTISILAQANKTQTTSQNRIGFVNSDAFYDETGIEELIEARKKIEKEFNPQQEELKKMAERYKNLYAEADKLLASGGFQRDKIEQLDKLKCEIKEKQEEIKAAAQKLLLEITTNINKKIAEAAKQFAKERGYALILDISKIKEESFILGNEKDEKNPDVTKEFIKFYNSVFGSSKSQ
jgi:Skp family chaperone for outer membrane proteins